jgi:hypothetical protein
MPYDGKMVIIVRNPFNAIHGALRMISQFYDEVVWVETAMKIATAMEQQWRTVVQPILSTYPSDRLKIIKYEDLVRDGNEDQRSKRIAVLQDLMHFMGNPTPDKHRIQCALYRTKAVIPFMSGMGLFLDVTRKTAASVVNMEESDEKHSFFDDFRPSRKTAAVVGTAEVNHHISSNSNSNSSSSHDIDVEMLKSYPDLACQIWNRIHGYVDYFGYKVWGDDDSEKIERLKCSEMKRNRLLAAR